MGLAMAFIAWDLGTPWWLAVIVLVAPDLSITGYAFGPRVGAGVYNAADDTEMLMGDWLDLVADRAGLPRPPRRPRAAFPERSSFMEESRRLDNRRMKRELGVRLRYRTVHEGLGHAEALGAHEPS